MISLDLSTNAPIYPQLHQIDRKKYPQMPKMLFSKFERLRVILLEVTTVTLRVNQKD